MLLISLLGFVLIVWAGPTPKEFWANVCLHKAHIHSLDMGRELKILDPNKSFKYPNFKILSYKFLFLFLKNV